MSKRLSDGSRAHRTALFKLIWRQGYLFSHPFWNPTRASVSALTAADLQHFWWRATAILTATCLRSSHVLCPKVHWHNWRITSHTLISTWKARWVRDRLTYMSLFFSNISRRHDGGSRKWISGSDLKDLDPRSCEIIDPHMAFWRKIHIDLRFTCRFFSEDAFGSNISYVCTFCLGFTNITDPKPLTDKIYSNFIGLETFSF